MKRIHLVPKFDIATNHRINMDCPCKPVVSNAKVDEEEAVVYQHKYQDGHEVVMGLCRDAGVKVEELIFRKVIAK